MSIDYTTNGSHQSLFGQPDIDQTFSSLQGGEINSGHAHNNSHLPINGHSLDRADSLDIPDHPSYDIFSSSSSGSLASQRYRTNASSSSSLGHNYALGVDSLYPASSFSDNLPPFHSSNSNPYDIMGGLPSSYSSGKPSPLTPNDVGPLSHPSGFPFSNGQSKEYSPHQSYHESMLDRRLSNVGGSYSSDFNDEFGGMGVNPNMGLNNYHPSNGLHQFQDRIGRLPSDSRFSGSGVTPLTVPSHLAQNHNSDLIRGVAPQATHAYRGDNGLSSFDDMPQFISPNPQVDYPLRMSVDENMARLRLQGAGDLQTFIRYVRHCSWLVRLRLVLMTPCFSSGHIWISL